MIDRILKHRFQSSTKIWVGGDHVLETKAAYGGCGAVLLGAGMRRAGHAAHAGAVPGGVSRVRVIGDLGLAMAFGFARSSALQRIWMSIHGPRCKEAKAFPFSLIFHPL